MVMTKANGVSHDTVPYSWSGSPTRIPISCRTSRRTCSGVANAHHDRRGLEALRLGVAATRARESGKTVMVADVK